MPEDNCCIASELRRAEGAAKPQKQETLIKNCATLPLALILVLWACVAAGWAAGPTISNIRSGQRPGTELVDIDYDLADPGSATLTISVAVSDNGGASYTLPAKSFAGAVGAGVTPGRKGQADHLECGVGLAEQVLGQCPLPADRKRRRGTAGSERHGADSGWFVPNVRFVQ